jgi:hypothetical protein
MAARRAAYPLMVLMKHKNMLGGVKRAIQVSMCFSFFCKCEGIFCLSNTQLFVFLSFAYQEHIMRTFYTEGSTTMAGGNASSVLDTNQQKVLLHIETAVNHSSMMCNAM